MHVDDGQVGGLGSVGCARVADVQGGRGPGREQHGGRAATSAWRLVQAKRAPEESRSDIQITPAVLAAPVRTGLRPGGWTGKVWLAPGMGGSWN